MKKEKVIPILFDTYVAAIKNSAGAKIFRNFYAKLDGKKTDIMKNGDLSCAWFVSSILYLFKLIKEPHATVDGTTRDLKQSGWEKIGKPKIGSIIVWEKNHNSHKHIGFYIDNNKTISNNLKSKCPIIHHWTFGVKNGKPVRKVEAIFWNNKLK